MKKCVLSAAVLALLVPAIHAMDGAAEPVVEVEVVVASEEASANDDVKVEVVDDVAPEVVICELQPCELPEGAVEKITTDEMVEIRTFGGSIEVEGGEGVEGGEPIMYMFGAPVEGGEPVAVEGETVDPNLVDLASQSGVAIEDTPTRGGDGEIQPHFRNLSAGPVDGDDVVLMAASSGGAVASASDLADPQLLNDEQRGAVRGLRSEAEEPTKTRSGLGKFMAKFRKPKSEVTQASAKVTDKSLSSKLAEVDRMRDTALRTGDQKALAKADKLEKELRAKAGTATRIPTRTK